MLRLIIKWGIFGIVFFDFVSIYIVEVGQNLLIISLVKSKRMIVEGYKIRREKKVGIVYCRMDKTMREKLYEIREKTGISTSELIRESVRRLFNEVAKKGNININI